MLALASSACLPKCALVSPQPEDHVYFCGVQYREEDYMIRDEVGIAV